MSSLTQRTNFPARELYERTLPAIVGTHSDVFYWPGSPWSEKSTRDQTEGDLHCWDVWCVPLSTNSRTAASLTEAFRKARRTSSLPGLPTSRRPICQRVWYVLNTTRE